MNRRLIVILTFLLALPLAAQTKRLVSRIDVRGNVPAEIVTSQSTLVEGRSYSDRDLDLAVARLRRLPFVFDARWSIEGETLVLEIEPVTRFFADLDASGAGQENRQSGIAALGGGGRLFLGAGGVAQGRLVQLVTDLDDGTAADLEYTHYGIGGTRFFAGAGISYDLFHEEGYEPDPTFRLFAGYPINLRQTVTLFASDEGFSGRRSVPAITRELHDFADRQTLSLRWTYDTTEDPFFARQGLIVNAGPSWRREESQFSSLAITAPDGRVRILTTRNEGITTSLAADAKKFWSVGTRGAIFSGLSVSRDSSENDGWFDDQFRSTSVDGNSAGIQVGYAHNFFDRLGAATGTRQRLEFGAGYTRREADRTFAFDPFYGPLSSDITTLSAGYVLRRNFATVRLGLSYTFD